MLKVGDPFPEFSLPDQNGKTHTKAEILGAKAIFYFYPKDDTTGCTVEACEFRDSMPRFTGATVFGVSPDSPKSHTKFAAKYNLPFILLADEETQLCEDCGVWVEKSMYGRQYMGVERTTFLVDEKGIISHVWNKVKPTGHAAEVLAAIG